MKLSKRLKCGKNRKKAKLVKKLLGYSATAGAALAMGAVPANALPTLAILEITGDETMDIYRIDFNDDGLNDLSIGVFLENIGGNTYTDVWATGLNGALVGVDLDLAYGGNAKNFTSKSNINTTNLAYNVSGGGMLACYGGSCTTGPGAFLGSRGFLGVKFIAGNETLFGWVDVSVNGDASQAFIYGYGLKDAAPVPEPGTLGTLAIGAAGLFAWRRREQKQKNKAKKAA